MTNILIKNEPNSADRENILIKLWLRKYKSIHTQKQYERVLKNFMKEIRVSSLKDVTPSHVSVYLSLQMSKKSPKTVALYQAVLSSMFSSMVFYSYLSMNPVDRTEKIRVPKEDIFRFLHPETVTKMIEVSKPGRNRALLMILYWSLARISEIIELRMDDFLVSESFADLILKGKGGKIRKVRLSRGKFDSIMKELGMDGEGIIGKRESLFKSSKGGQISRTQAWRIFKEAAIKVGVDRSSPHWFRHSSITESLKRGASLKSVQRAAGHSSAETTMRYYDLSSDESPSDFL